MVAASCPANEMYNCVNLFLNLSKLLRVEKVKQIRMND